MKSKKKTQDEMKKLGKEVTDLKFTENVLEEKIKNLDEKQVNLENQCNELYNNSLKADYFQNKSVELEDSFRRSNLRIDGIAEGPNENWEQCEEQLQNVFKEKLGLDHAQIERAHQEERKNGKSGNKLKGTDISLMKIFAMKPCNIGKSYGRLNMIK